MAKKLKGTFAAQEPATVSTTEAPAETLAPETKDEALKRLNPSGIPEVELKEGTFKITAKVDGVEKYKNDKEPYFYVQVPSFATALKLYGAKLSEDQQTFLEEALKGEDTGKANAEILEVINADLDNSASRARYQKVLAFYTPLTEENIENAHATIVRNYLKTQRNSGVNLSDEIAVGQLQTFGVIPKEFTLDMFRANKGKR